jgi:PAS domain S-box-containing protein
MGNIRDIIEVTEAEARARAMADAAPVMSWIAGADKQRLWFNRAWRLFTGRSIEQELGGGWADVVHSEDLKQCLQTYYAACDAREPFAIEYRLRRQDGEYRWIVDHGVPLYGDHGGFLGYIGSALDITDRKRAGTV